MGGAAVRLLAVLAVAATATGAPAAHDALFPVTKDGKWGYIDRAGTLVIPPRFSAAEPFSEGLAAVELEDGEHAYIDASGAVALVPEHEPAGTGLHRKFSEGLAAVRDGGRIGFMDRAGKLVIPGRYSSAEEFSEGRALVCDPDGCGYVDQTGRALLGPRFLGGTPFRHGVAGVWVRKGSMGSRRYRVYDVERGWRTGEFENVASMSEGLIAVQYDDKWGFVDRDLRGVIRPRFQQVYPFTEGLAVAYEVNWSCGYIDRSGAFAIPPTRFRYCHPFSEGRARVELLGDPTQPAPAYVDRTGAIVVEGSKASPPFVSGQDFAHGLAQVEARGPAGQSLIGYIDARGRYVWAPQH